MNRRYNFWFGVLFEVRSRIFHGKGHAIKLPEEGSYHVITRKVKLMVIWHYRAEPKSAGASLSYSVEVACFLEVQFFVSLAMMKSDHVEVLFSMI